jgi:hypothetical protein
MFLFARYGVLLRAENLTGDSMTVDVFSDALGSTVSREVEEGDLVLEVQNTARGTTGAVWVVHNGRRWTLAGNQPTAGDVLVSVCPVSDLDYQAGSLLVFAEDDTFVPANLGLILAL